MSFKLIWITNWVQVLVHLTWLYHNIDILIKPQDSANFAIILAPLILISQIFAIIRTPINMVPILLYKTILATGVSIILAFLFGLSLVDSFLSWKTLCWAILFAQRIVSLIDGPMKNVPFVTNWSLGKDPVTVAKELVPVLTAVFSWSASIVIPLDWERSWQKWPIPNLLGAELGFLAGLVLQTIVLGMISLSKKKTH